MAHSPPPDPVRPTAEDPVAASASELLGGPAGKRIATGLHWWSPVRVIAMVMIGMYALGMVQKLPCYNSGWFYGPGTQYTHACYSDIPHLYGGRGFADGLIPYFDRIPEQLSESMEYLEYPVLTGLFMQAAAWPVPSDAAGHQPAQVYWLINAGLLLICAVVIAVCISRTQRNRPWDGLMVALAPAFALTATINWDLLAGALTCAGLLMWSRSRPLAAGILIGLATAAKLYPLLILGPLLVLCWRAGRWRAFGIAAGSAVGAWLLVNLPLMVLAPEGWAKFYTFSQERPVDFGSFWLIITQRTGVDLTAVNALATLLTLLGCAAIGALALIAPRRPRLAQLAFLAVAVFILFNKVYSPQYVLWLIPLAVLARPRWRDFLVWQACEVLYFLGIWMYLAYSTGDQQQGLPPTGYHLAILLHLFGTLYLCTLVVRDVLRPERDIVRRDGSDDPGGGVLNAAPDVFTLGRGREAAPALQQPRVQWGVTEPMASDVSRET